MKNIGSIFRDARRRKGYSRQKVSDVTKIKLSFIEAIEKSQWSKLPALSILTGFVRSIAKSIGVDEDLAVAVLKRDYPPQKVQVPVKENISRGPSWSPRVTFFLGIAIVMMLVLGYLGFQYKRFVSAPALTVDVPKEGQVIKTRTLVVGGKTTPDATVSVNNQPAIVVEDGTFSTQIDVTTDTKDVRIVATSRSGKVTTVSRTIKVE